MKLVISPKDNLNKIELDNVETFALEGDTLLVVFEDGKARNYPLMHIWYYQSEVKKDRSKPPKKNQLPFIAPYYCFFVVFVWVFAFFNII